MRMRTLSVAALAAVLAVGASFAGEALKPGLAPGEKMGAFDVEDVTGPNKGKTLCYV